MDGERKTKEKEIGQKIWHKFAAFLAECPNPKLDSFNKHYGSKYASLEECLNTAKNALRKRNLSMIQKVSSVMVEGGLKVSVETVFSDETLESITFPPLECFVPNDSPNLIQALGKAITYLRRYSLLAACGVVGEEDDDGNAVGKATASSPARPVRQFEAKSAPPKPPEHQPAIEPAFLQLGLVPEEISALQKGMSLPELRQFYNYLKQAGKEMEGQGGVDAVIAVLREEGGGAVTPQVAKGRIRG